MTLQEILAGKEIKIHKQRFEDCAIDSLQPHPRNPRRGDLAAIAESVIGNGFYGAIVVQEATRFILAGNHRWLVAKQAGSPTIPCLMLDVDDDDALKILLADNRTAELGGFDDETLKSLLTEIGGRDDFAGTGYDDFSLEILTMNTARDLAKQSLAASGAAEPDAPQIPQYNIVFEDEAKQKQWYEWMRSLKNKYPEEELASNRMLRFIAEAAGGN